MASNWLTFVKAHKSMRLPSGALDLKAISRLYHERGYDLRKIHKVIEITQQGTGIKSKIHACGTGCKVSELTSTSDNKKVTCAKCLKQLRGYDPAPIEDKDKQLIKLNSKYSGLLEKEYSLMLAGRTEKDRKKQDEISDALFEVQHEMRQIEDQERKKGTLKSSFIQKGYLENTYDPAPLASKPPERWFAAMKQGIDKKSDVRNPYAIVRNIWARLTPKKRAEIRAREAKGERFKYDLPLPDDRSTRGVGTLRMVKPFKLAEVQVNLSLKDYIAALKSGLFSKMKRQDGTTALVARCKSDKKNCNIFIDKI